MAFLLKNPVLAIQNIDKNGNFVKDEIVTILNAMDKDKKPIMLPLKIEGRGNINYLKVDANIIKSVYGKTNFQDYIDKYLKNENLLLIENKKIRNLKH